MTGTEMPKTSESDSAAFSAPRLLDRLDGSTAAIRRGRMGRSRMIAVFVAAILTFSLVGGCGSKPNVATQKTEQVAQATQAKVLAAQHFRTQVAAAMKRAAAQRLARQRQAAAQRLARQRQAAAISAAIQTKTVDVSRVLQYFGISLDNLCGPIGPNGGGKAQRQARQLLARRRKQALYYLNLSCPSL